MSQMDLSLNSRKALLAILVQIQNIDSDRSSRETSYIEYVAKELGLIPSQIEEIVENPEAFPMIPPAKESQRMTLLYYMLFFMNVDGRVTKEEEQIVKKWGFQLGFRPELTSELVDLIKQHINQKLPPEKMLDKIRTYLN